MILRLRIRSLRLRLILKVLSTTKANNPCSDPEAVYILPADPATLERAAEVMANEIHRIEMRDRQTWEPDVMARACLAALLGLKDK